MALETSAPREDVVHLRYRNREVTTADLEFLKEKCASTATRREVAKAVCDLSDPLIFLDKSMGGGNLPRVWGVEAR